MNNIIKERTPSEFFLGLAKSLNLGLGKKGIQGPTVESVALLLHQSVARLASLTIVEGSLMREHYENELLDELESEMNKIGAIPQAENLRDKLRIALRRGNENAEN